VNDEANLNIYDAVFAAEQAIIFESDKSRSRLMTRTDYKNRSVIGKMFDSVAGSCASNSEVIQVKGLTPLKRPRSWLNFVIPLPELCAHHVFQAKPLPDCTDERPNAIVIRIYD